MITLKHGDVFNTLGDVENLFGKSLPAGGDMIIDGVLSVWLPRRAVPAGNHFAPADNGRWLNLVNDDEEEITEIDLTTGTPAKLGDKPGGHRLVFVRSADIPYRFIGLYTLAYLSPSKRTRVFTRQDREFPFNLETLAQDFPADLEKPAAK
jgi:hypothetical protein